MSVAFANPLSGRTYGVTLTSLSVPAAVADYECAGRGAFSER